MNKLLLFAAMASGVMVPKGHAATQLVKQQVSVTLSAEASDAMKAVIGDRPDRQAADIEASGSMAPTLDENYIVIIEETSFENLTKGRIAVFRGSWTRHVLCHRLISYGDHNWATKGDRLSETDPYPMTAKTYTGFAVVAAIHKRTGGIKMP